MFTQSSDLEDYQVSEQGKIRAPSCLGELLGIILHSSIGIIQKKHIKRTPIKLPV